MDNLTPSASVPTRNNPVHIAILFGLAAAAIGALFVYQTYDVTQIGSRTQIERTQ
ncbi:hypothetical protein NGM99_10420 [Mesorhizobium sp. RP14(2022)]|uniref:Uncharacterized protein n=1 Tax=Mesorhizobium liriopis TaxID=2953882 RepID=A0ABT1C5W5_9HYPH|nr:hypothetical protein [Mesorhizobium liriopis]MCO6050199.1 hypothetical protein [Mesorhizobium liriopis]